MGVSGVDRGSGFSQDYSYNHLIAPRTCGTSDVHAKSDGLLSKSLYRRRNRERHRWSSVLPSHRFQLPAGRKYI
eukprot:47039-Amphidinium_carterae.1